MLFALLAVTAVIVVDFQDQTFPEALHAKGSVSLDFTSSDLSDAQARQELAELSDRLGLGLVKVAPDLQGDQSGQVYVEVGTRESLPETIRRFGSPGESRVVSHAALAQTYASGTYLITGSAAEVDQLQSSLTAHGLRVTWQADDLRATLRILRAQSGFLISILAALGLLISLVLYWLTVKARGRALRSLAGVSIWRIQYEDLGAFAVIVLGALAVVTIVAVAWVGLTHGWLFAPTYATTLLVFGGVVTVAALLTAVAMSLASWPSPALIARREPAVKSLRKVTAAVKGVTFVLVVAAVAPTLHAWTTARAHASQLAHWKELSNQVALAFDGGMGEDGFEKRMPQVGHLIQDAEEKHDVALSYAWHEDDLGGSLGPYDAFAFVNPGWLSLVDPDTPANLHLIAEASLPPAVGQYLKENLPIWSRGTPAQSLDVIAFYSVDQGADLPLLVGGGGGELIYPRHPIVAMISHPHAALNDSFLASAASTRNLIFTGLGPTQKLVAKYGLAHQVTVKYAAADGILLAQVTGYLAWLQGISLIALVVALVVAVLVSAFIQAILKARRDFPLRLAGRTWREIIRSRVQTEWLIGLTLTLVVIVFRAGSGLPIVLLAGLLALAISPAAHVVASRWMFSRVTQRRP